MKPYLIGITGGIGSGKSTVSQIISHLGYKVYNSDVRANEIINDNISVKEKLIESFGSDIYEDSTLNKEYVSKLIFNNESAKIKINSIVHPEVILDFNNWVKRNNTEKNLFKAQSKDALNLKTVGIGIYAKSGASTVELSKDVRKKLIDIKRNLPDGLNIEVAFDRATYVGPAISEVYKTLVVAFILVVAIIYLFLGNIKAVIAVSYTHLRAHETGRNIV